MWSERVIEWLNNALYSIDLNYIITKINYSHNRTFCMYNLKIMEPDILYLLCRVKKEVPHCKMFTNLAL